MDDKKEKICNSMSKRVSHVALTPDFSKRQRDDSGSGIGGEGEEQPQIIEEKIRPKHAPAPADLNMTGNVSMLSKLGQSLIAALHSTNSSSCSRSDRSGDVETDFEFRVDEIMRDEVINGFRTAMAEEMDSMIIEKAAPACLMKGNIEYYNRYRGQWRIRVSDVEMHRRKNLCKKEIANPGRYNKWKKVPDFWKANVDEDEDPLILEGVQGEKFYADVLTYDDTE